jgi:hypothetical protein
MRVGVVAIWPDGGGGHKATPEGKIELGARLLRPAHIVGLKLLGQRNYLKAGGISHKSAKFPLGKLPDLLGFWIFPSGCTSKQNLRPILFARQCALRAAWRSGQHHGAASLVICLRVPLTPRAFGLSPSGDPCGAALNASVWDERRIGSRERPDFDHVAAPAACEAAGNLCSRRGAGFGGCAAAFEAGAGNSGGSIMSDLLFAGARTALAAAGAAIDRLQERYSAAKAATDKANAEQGERTAEIDAHKKRLAELTMRQTAEMEARRRELANRENAVGEREREAERKVKWATEHEATISRRAADLAQRYRGAA